MKCKICLTENKVIFSSKILYKYDIEYFHCKNCGFLQTEEPYWLDEAYEESINVSDTGILARNLYLSDISSLIIYFFFDKSKKYLDFAGGYGILTRLMRDIGFDFYWYDKYSENLVARGFEQDEKSMEVELITIFEAFEHFTEPISEIENMLNISKNILFSTELLPSIIPKPHEWWYYGLEHGQHISFYSLETLEYIAKKYNLNLYSNGHNIHLFTEKDLNRYCFQRLFQNNQGRQLVSFVKGSIINKIFFKKYFRTILKYRTQRELIAYVKTSMKSKTVDDMNSIIEKMDKK